MFTFGKSSLGSQGKINVAWWRGGGWGKTGVKVEVGGGGGGGGGGERWTNSLIIPNPLGCAWLSLSPAILAPPPPPPPLRLPRQKRSNGPWI